MYIDAFPHLAVAVVLGLNSRPPVLQAQLNWVDSSTVIPERATECPV